MSNYRQFIEFVKVGNSVFPEEEIPITSIYNMELRATDEVIGTVRWHSLRKEYCFISTDSVILFDDFLKGIRQCIKTLTQVRVPGIACEICESKDDVDVYDGVLLLCKECRDREESKGGD